MSKVTPIQWCDSSVNPVMGCDGCELWSFKNKICYAGVLHGRRRGHKGFAPTFEQPTKFPGRTTEAAQWSDLGDQDRPDKPWLDGLPRSIFVSDMGDALSKAIDFEYLNHEIVEVAATEAGQCHRWLWLTKRPKRMAQFYRWVVRRGGHWPTNLWAGTTVTSQQKLGRLRELAKVGDADTRRFVSVEPQWGPIELGEYLPSLHWVIQGGESGAVDRPFDIAWARSLRDECRTAGVAYFLKQLGRAAVDEGVRLELVDRMGGDWNEWPADLRIREVPRS